MIRNYLERLRVLANAEADATEGYRNGCLQQAADQIDIALRMVAMQQTATNEFGRQLQKIMILLGEGGLYGDSDRKSET